VAVGLHLYIIGIKQFLVPVCVSKDANIIPVAGSYKSKTEVVAQGENNGQLLAKN